MAKEPRYVYIYLRGIARAADRGMDYGAPAVCRSTLVFMIWNSYYGHK